MFREMFVVVLFLFICLLGEVSHSFKRGSIRNIELIRLTKDYHIKEDIINYNRFQYVYKIKKHPIHIVTKDILNFLKNKCSFHLVYNKCPLFYNENCFRNILIKDDNVTTSIKSNFFFSKSFLYLPQVTSLYPTALNKVTEYPKNVTENPHIIPNNYSYNDNSSSNNTFNNITFNGDTSNGDTFNDGVYNVHVSNNCTYKHEKGEREKERERERERERKGKENGRKHYSLETENKNCHFLDSENLCIISNVYRKDNIDKYHFPFFTQMDIYIKIENELINKKKKLIYFLCEFLFFLFQKKFKWRIRKDFFDFTKESLQAEVFFNNKWVEILGAGIMKQKISFKNKKSYIHNVHDYMAVGIGIDRVAMICHQINRIRDLFLYITRKEADKSEGEIQVQSGMRMNEVNEKGEKQKKGKKEEEEEEEEREREKERECTQMDESAKTYENAEIEENRETDTNGGNILSDCPQREGSELKEKLLPIILKEGEKRRNDFLYFQNLYDVKNEERDFSFYVNKKWDHEAFIKYIYNLKAIKNVHFLKHVFLFDTFFNKEAQKTSYTYRFVYVPTGDIMDQQVFRNYVKKLHADVIDAIRNFYEINIR